jgi:hypothetical protein
MGPDCVFAREQGRKEGEKLLQQVIEQHKMLDITDPKYNGFGLPGARDRWTAAKEKFLEAMSELFVEDACNGF